MALAQIEYPVNLSAQADFDKHGNLIEAGLWDKVDKPLLVRDGVIPQGVVLQIGSDVYHATSDTAITGTASDYVEVTPDGEGAATAAYVATLTGVTWTAQYNGYYNAAATKLYLFDEGKAFADGAVLAMFSRYVTRTESGDVYIKGDISAGGDVDAGGAGSFGGDLVSGGSLGAVGMGAREYQAGSLSAGQSKVIPAGIWCWHIISGISGNNSTSFQISDSGGSFRTMGQGNQDARIDSGMVISDGTNARLFCDTGSSQYRLIKVSI